MIIDPVLIRDFSDAAELEAVERRDEPEQAAQRELTLPGDLAQLDDEGDEECLTDPPVDFSKQH